MQPELRIELLGDFKVAIGDEPVTSINTPRLQAFLAYLLLHRNAPQSRQYIAFLFWPDSSETQAQSNLRNLIVKLHHALPNFERYVAVDRLTLRWRNESAEPGAHFPYTLDVSDFERAIASSNHASNSTKQLIPVTDSPEQIRALRTAVDLYTGDLLPGCYDDWAAAPRERLRQAHLEAMQQLISAFEQVNDLASAIIYARRLLRHNSLQEEIYRRLMHLYVANGDGAAAMAVYRACESLLRRELGVEPGPATRGLARQVEDALGSEAEAGRERRRKKGARGSRAGRGDEPQTLPGNLPAPTTLFIGREREVSIVSDLLRAPGIRLVTLTGTPGTGKTRVALQVASSLTSGQAAFAPFGSSKGTAQTIGRGIYFVPLASISETGLVASTIAHALGVVESGSRSLNDALLEYLRDKSLLLVLDNFEHLLPAASLVAEMLRTCPGLKVLATSRSPLNLQGEHEYPLSPMSVPGRDVLTSATLVPDDLVQYEAVALFVERALEVWPGFALTRTNARSVGEICRKLEGLPLAIELAAARIKVLTPEAILSRLDRRLKLLVGGRLDLPPRQQTLETAIAWSYNLLDQAEQALFRKLAVFSGGCTLDAAEAVIGDGDLETSAFLDRMAALVNKSLLSRIDTGSVEGAARFFMLETIGEYARERLRESGEQEGFEREHARYFMALAEEAEPRLVGPKQSEWMDRLEDEHDNFRSALRWAREVADDLLVRTDEGAKGTSEWLEATGIGLRIASALAQFWNVRGYQNEGREQLAAALATAEATEPPIGYPTWRAYLAKANIAAGELAMLQDDQPSARPLYEQSLAIFREIGDKRGIADSLDSQGFLEHFSGSHAAARSLYEQSLAIRREIGDKRGIANSFYHLGSVAQFEGDYIEAQSLLEQSLVIAREVGDKSAVALTLGSLGRLAQLEGDLTTARSLHEQSLAIFREIGHRGGIAETLGILANVACAQSDYQAARSLYRQSLMIRREIGDRFGIAVCLAGVGELALSEGATKASALSSPSYLRAKAAARLLGAAEALADSIGAALIADLRSVYERGVTLAHEMLDQGGFAKARDEGRAMTLEEAVALAESLE